MKFNKVENIMPWNGFHRHFIPSIIVLILASIGTYFWSAWSFYRFDDNYCDDVSCIYLR